MNEQSAIRFDHVTLLLPVGKGKKRARILAEMAMKEGQWNNKWVGGLISSRRNMLTVTALNDISLTIERGDKVGLIGHNGAGKSTILRVMAGIYYPSSGACEVRGKVSTLFTPTLGLDVNSTGLENIELAGITLGLSRSAIKSLIPQIVEFCELGHYLQMPMRTYSAGMRTRLGFAIATSIEPDILLIDEVFGAGDRRFQNKARLRLDAMLGKANTLVLASHADDIVRSFCNKAIWMEHGHIRAMGAVDEVLAQFNALSDQDSAQSL